ncbi:hypothetical protein EIP91_011161 [Steccherinum ochraceum]|uniref:Uncharacterized protein n=1 Tax=Steccherinum ochraceum TaxID=92696 RepID=A0A4R0RMA9_9APHY|nr:hypothetical protein EIP91_011161 [Steccherinum ochraceum]
MAADKPTAVNGTAAAKDTGSAADYNAADIAMLNALLAQQQPSSDADPASMSDLDIAEELRRIEAAHGLAEGMEDRLDGLIGNLDRLLESLQGAGAGPVDPAKAQSGDTTTAPSETESKKVDSSK